MYPSPACYCTYVCDNLNSIQFNSRVGATRTRTSLEFIYLLACSIPSIHPYFRFCFFFHPSLLNIVLPHPLKLYVDCSKTEAEKRGQRNARRTDQILESNYPPVSYRYEALERCMMGETNAENKVRGYAAEQRKIRNRNFVSP